MLGECKLVIILKAWRKLFIWYFLWSIFIHWSLHSFYIEQHVEKHLYHIFDLNVLIWDKILPFRIVSMWISCTLANFGRHISMSPHYTSLLKFVSISMLCFIPMQNASTLDNPSKCDNLLSTILHIWISYCCTCLY